jgi:hypothetical protein
MVTRVVSIEAETASKLLFQTLGAHRKAVAALHPGAPARLAPASASGSEQIQCQATLVRLLSITESFTAQLLLGEVDKAAARAASSSIDSVWEDAAIKGTNSWKEQKASYKSWLGVDTDWKVEERLAEARNAVAHGLGALTRRQLRNEQSVRDKLKMAGITMVGVRIVLSDAALASAAADCRDLIHRVDLAVQARPQKFR